jgi:hypothetical protein
MDSRADWLPGPDAWKLFVHKHPELGYKPGRMNFHNFLRYYRDRLIEADAIRRAKNKFWIAHGERFCEVAFDCATGHVSGVISSVDR